MIETREVARRCLSEARVTEYQQQTATAPGTIDHLANYRSSARPRMIVPTRANRASYHIVHPRYLVINTIPIIEHDRIHRSSPPSPRATARAEQSARREFLHLDFLFCFFSRSSSSSSSTSTSAPHPAHRRRIDTITITSAFTLERGP